MATTTSENNGQGYDGKIFEELALCEGQEAEVRSRIKVYEALSEAWILRQECADMTPRKLARETWRLQPAEGQERALLYLDGRVFREETTLPPIARIPDPFAPNYIGGDSSPDVAGWLSDIFLSLVSKTVENGVTKWYFRKTIHPNETLMTDDTHRCSVEKATVLAAALRDRAWMRGMDLDAGHFVGCDARAGDRLPSDLSLIDGIIFFNTSGSFTDVALPSNLKSGFGIMIDNYFGGAEMRFDFSALSEQKVFLYHRKIDSGAGRITLDGVRPGLTYDLAIEHFAAPALVLINGAVPALHAQNLRPEEIPLQLKVNGVSEEVPLPGESLWSSP